MTPNRPSPPTEPGCDWHNPAGLARILLAATALYILFCSCIVGLETGHFLRPQTLYYYSIISLAVFFSFRALREVDWATRAPARHLVYVGGAVFLGVVAWWLYRKPQLLAFSAWFDEVGQFTGGRRPQADIVSFAAGEQQPPIDYFLSRFALLTFGISEWSMLCHAFIFSTLGLFVFVLWLVQVRMPLPAMTIPLVFFAGHHVLLQYSTEARPISLAVFYALLWMIFMLQSLQERRVHISALFAGAVLLLYSVGLQPIFFLFLMTLVLIPAFHRELGKRRTLAFILAACLIPLLLFLPTVQEIFIESYRRDQFFRDSFATRWLHGLVETRMADFSSFNATLQPATWLLFGAPILLLAASLIGRRRRQTLDPRLAIAGLGYLILFPFLFHVFWRVIDWPLYPKYFVLWPVGAAALGALCAARLGVTPGNDLRIPVKGTALAVGAIVLMHLHQGFIPQHRRLFHASRAEYLDWRKFMEIPARDQKALFVEVPYAPFNDFNWDFMAAPIYNTETRLAANIMSRHGKRRRFDVCRPSTGLPRLSGAWDGFFIFPRGRLSSEDFEALGKSLPAPGAEISQPQDGYLLLRVRAPVDILQTTLDLFAKVSESKPNSPFNFYLLEALHHEASRGNDASQARHWRRRLTALSKANPEMAHVIAQALESDDEP